jgi:hypothetical protein
MYREKHFRPAVWIALVLPLGSLPTGGFAAGVPAVYRQAWDAARTQIDAQMNPKPAYQALERLINHEWRTNCTLTTDASGRARFRGFGGCYAVELTAGGATRKLSFELHEGQEPQRATFKP